MKPGIRLNVGEEIRIKMAKEQLNQVLEIRLYLSNLKTYEHFAYLIMKYRD